MALVDSHPGEAGRRDGAAAWHPHRKLEGRVDGGEGPDRASVGVGDLYRRGPGRRGRSRGWLRPRRAARRRRRPTSRCRASPGRVRGGGRSVGIRTAHSRVRSWHGGLSRRHVVRARLRNNRTAPEPSLGPQFLGGARGLDRAAQARVFHLDAAVLDHVEASVPRPCGGFRVGDSRAASRRSPRPPRSPRRRRAGRRRSGGTRRRGRGRREDRRGARRRAARGPPGPRPSGSPSRGRSARSSGATRRSGVRSGRAWGRGRRPRRFACARGVRRTRRRGEPGRRPASAGTHASPEPMSIPRKFVTLHERTGRRDSSSPPSERGRRTAHGDRA